MSSSASPGESASSSAAAGECASSGATAGRRRWRLAAAKLGLWPDEKPDVEPYMHGWVHNGNQRLLQRILSSRQPRVIVELGSWLGLCTTLMLEETAAFNSAVFAVDPWDPELLLEQQLAQYESDSHAIQILGSVPLFPTFLVNTWEHRRRLFPLKMTSLEGIATIHALGVTPELVYIDGDHSYTAVLADLEACEAAFPGALLVGDDWQWTEVRSAVRHFCSTRPLRVEAHPRENWWWLERTTPLATRSHENPEAAEGPGKRRRTTVEFVTQMGDPNAQFAREPAS